MTHSYRQAVSSNSVGYRGVTRHKNRFRAKIIVNKQRIYLGHYLTPEAAARAYDLKAIELLGDKAALNFPDESPTAYKALKQEAHTLSTMVEKARRASILLGDISINAYQLPSGAYALSGRGVTKAVNEDKTTLTRVLAQKSLEALPDKDFCLGQPLMKAITGESFIPISLEYAVEYWGLMALKGNKLALNLLLACAAETLERRLDSAFGVKKSQEHYNQDMSLRMQQMAISKKWFSILATRYEKLYGRAPTQTYLDYWNETVNLALFNTPSFSDGTDNMTEDQRMKILNFESLCIHMSNKYRFSTPEFLIGKALTCLS